jgi:hypothetical protein
MITRIMAIFILILCLFLSVNTVQAYQDHPAGVISHLNTGKPLPNPQIKIVALPEDTDSTAGGTGTINGWTFILLMVLLVLTFVLIYLIIRKIGKQKSDPDDESDPDEDSERFVKNTDSLIRKR